MSIAAIVLAAGRSGRMGSAKPLLDWGGQALIEYQIEQLRKAPVDRVVVVVGHLAQEILPFVRKAGAEAVINERYGDGRASSQRAGADALADETRTIVVLNVDQPRPRSVIERLLAAHQQGPNLITVPSFGDRRGHPPVFDGWLLPELRTVQQATRGLRAVMLRNRTSVVAVPFESDVVLLDINTPEEYESARRTYFEQVTA